MHLLIDTCESFRRSLSESRMRKNRTYGLMKGDRWKVVPNNIPAESGRINSNTTWKMGNLSLLYPVIRKEHK